VAPPPRHTDEVAIVRDRHRHDQVVVAIGDSDVAIEGLGDLRLITVRTRTADALTVLVIYGYLG
jgi:hypothetical protein